MNSMNVSQVVKLLLALSPDERKVAIALANTMAAPEPPKRPTCEQCGRTFDTPRGAEIHAGHIHRKQLKLKGVK